MTLNCVTNVSMPKSTKTNYVRPNGSEIWYIYRIKSQGHGIVKFRGEQDHILLVAGVVYILNVLSERKKKQYYKSCFVAYLEIEKNPISDFFNELFPNLHYRASLDP